MSDILYQYDANYAALDDIGQALNNVEHLRGDIAQVFGALTDVYTGEAANALQAAQLRLSQQLDELVLDMQALKNAGVQQQIDTAALDHQLAGGF
ncbi:hypothetical protein [Mycobacterium sp. SP-6446]|uniref:hypothetical protein n=1 Tax=Mycobacterium sp. SP-6446 TaxID=1834162 RepID=UPI00096E4C79|nr:hypothetical protein [Mycobacterium sp. SP-6446]OMC08443.1 hypothetical protein A5736_06580 [Mycobacterium sp. SP-6446]